MLFAFTELHITDMGNVTRKYKRWLQASRDDSERSFFFKDQQDDSNIATDSKFSCGTKR